MTAHSASPDPKTEAGKRLDLAWPGTHLDRLDWHEAILAIEAEAATGSEPRTGLRASVADIVSRMEPYQYGDLGPPGPRPGVVASWRDTLRLALADPEPAGSPDPAGSEHAGQSRARDGDSRMNAIEAWSAWTRPEKLGWLAEHSDYDVMALLDAAIGRDAGLDANLDRLASAVNLALSDGPFMDTISDPGWPGWVEPDPAGLGLYEAIHGLDKALREYTRLSATEEQR